MAAGTTTRGGRGRNTRNKTGGRRAASTLGGRILGTFMVVVLLYLFLAGRLAYLQVVQHAHFQKMAAELRGHTCVLPARRGLLLDRGGTLLVRNEPAATIVLDPNAWYGRIPGDTPEARRAAALDGLARCLPDVDVATLALKVSERLPSGRFRPVDVRRQASLTLAEKIKAENLPGVGILAATRRVAMNGPLAAHILGFTDPDGRGLEGLEKGLDQTLAGQPGLLDAEFDTRGRAIPGTIRQEVPPRDGRDVLLTLDAGLQQDVQEILGKAFQRYRAEAASALVLDPKTGDILALANFPTYDVNRREGAPAACRLDRAVTSPFEPGSTLKVVTMAAALEDGKVSAHTRFYCAGKLQIGRRAIHCVPHRPYEHGHGEEDALGVIRNSCNIATAECAFRLGKNNLWEFERKFGFGERTGSGLSGESRGLLSLPTTWSDMQLANVSFGQGISVTLLQLAAAYAAIANDGVWMRPHIVRATRCADGSDVREVAPEAGRRVVSVHVAREVRRMLQAVVDGGTGKAAALDGYTAGGKTGTAQIARHGHYQSSRYVTSFAGMAPMSDPQFVIVVAITAPQGERRVGGVVAAPVFKAIAEKALLARRMPRDRLNGPARPNGKRPQNALPAWDV